MSDEETKAPEGMPEQFTESGVGQTEPSDEKIRERAEAMDLRRAYERRRVYKRGWGKALLRTRLRHAALIVFADEGDPLMSEDQFLSMARAAYVVCHAQLTVDDGEE